MKSLNHIYRVIWSETLRTWIAVSELTKAKGKSVTVGFRQLVNKAARSKSCDFITSLNSVFLAVLCSLALPAQANPIGATVVNGAATFATNGNVLTVTNTPGAIINWQGFSIGANEITRFAQQSANSAVLNRVISNSPSSILGSLQSNGRVFLINPNGIVFGANATVDVAGMVASTLNLSNADFLSGRYNFALTPGAQALSNAGNLTAQDGGQIYLIAPNVDNTGIINAPNGEILLAAGNSVELVNSANPNLRVSITAPAGDATNVGQLVASAGSLGLFGTVVKNTGKVSADSAVLQGGKIVFKATTRAEVAGSVSANGTTGGVILVLAPQIGIMDNASIQANGTKDGGTILIGGDYQGKNPNIPNAQVTYVSPTASISANASDNGNGGKIIVWADNTTRAYGSLSAKGGVNSGNGGFIETSGHYLDVTGIKISAQAPTGEAGTWLLDPNNITIATGADTNIQPNPTAGLTAYTTTADSSIITPATIEAVLNTGSNVIITTSSAAPNTQLGDITVSSAIAKTAGAAATLTLNASNNITINQPISSTVGALNLTLNHGAAGSATLANNLSLLGGNLDVQNAGVGGTGTGKLNVTAGSTTLTGTLSVADLGILAGTLTLDGTATTLNSLTLSGTLTGTGAITVSNAFTWNHGGVLDATAAATLTTAAGSTTTMTDANALGANRTWNNQGTATWAAIGGCCRNMTLNGTVNNSGIFILNSPLSTYNDVVGTGTFNNSGELRKTLNTSAVTTSFSAVFNNQTTGVVNVNSGTLSFTGTGTDLAGSVYNVAAGNTLQFGGSRSIAGNIAGAGNVTFFNGGKTFTLTGDYNISGTTLGSWSCCTASTVTFTGTVTNAGTTLTQVNDWGTLDFSGITAGQATGFANITSISNSGNMTLKAGTVLTALTTVTQNSGTLNLGDQPISLTNLTLSSTLTGSNPVTILTGGTFTWNHGGVLDATVAATLTTQAGSTTTMTDANTLGANRTWNNQGTATWAAVGGCCRELTLNGTVNNSGIFILNSPLASINNVVGTGTFNNSGELRKTLNGTALTTSFAPALNNQATGVMNINSGGLTLGGTFTQSGTVNVAAGTTLTKAASFTNNGTLAGSGTIDIGGAANSVTNFGTISPGVGVGGTGTLTFNGQLQLQPSSVLNIDLNANLSGQYDIVNVNAGMLGINGTLNLSGVGGAGTYPIISAAGGTGGTFTTVNAGSFSIQASPTTSVIVNANSAFGSIFWDGGAGTANWADSLNWSADQLPVSTDSVLLGAGLAVTHTTGDHTIAGLTVNSANSLNVSGGSITVSGATNVGGTLTVSGGTLTLNGAASVSSLALNSGLLNGTGTLTIPNGGVATHTEGTLAQINVNIANGGVYNISNTTAPNATTPFFTPATVNNSGTVNWNGTANQRSPNGTVGGVGGATWVTVFNNLSGANFNIQNNRTWDACCNGGDSFTFNNQAGATVTKTGGGITSFGSGTSFNNAGQVTVSTGSLSLLGNGGANTGAFTVASGATLNLQGTATSAFTNHGTLSMSNATLNGAVLNNGTLTSTAGNNVIVGALSTPASGATLNVGSGSTLSLTTGTNNAVAGNIQGTINVAASGTLDVPTGSMVHQRVGNNNGAVNLATGATMAFWGGTDSGVYNMASGSALVFTSNGGHTMTGTTAITGLGDVHFIDNVTVNISGSVAVNSLNNGASAVCCTSATLNGTLTANTVNWSNPGVTGYSSTLTLNGASNSIGTLNLAAPHTLSSNGALSINTLNMLGGTLNIGTGKTLTITGSISPGGAGTAGVLSITGNLALDANSVLNIDVGGTGAGQSDKLSVTGNVTLGGTLNATQLGGYVPANGDAIPFLTMTGTANGTFATTNLPANFSAGYNLATGEAARLIYGATPGTVTFTNAGNTLDWGLATNWSTGALPTSTETALLSAGFAVTHTTGDDTISGLTINTGNSLDVSGGSLMVSGAITASGAVTVSGGTLSLNGSSNLLSLNLLSGTLNGTGDLLITNSFSQTGGAINAASLSINQAVGALNLGNVATSGTIKLVSAGGAITQMAGTTLAATSLSAQGISVNLPQANPVGVIAGSASGGDFVYKSSNGLMITNVNSVNGITVPNANNIILEGSSAGISQATGSLLSGGGLSLKTAGNVNLTQANTVGKVAGDLKIWFSTSGTGTGSFNFKNSGDLIIGEIFGVDHASLISGVATNNNSINLATSGLLTVTQPINAGTGTSSKIALQADTLALYNTVTSGAEVAIAPYTAARAVTVGSATCSVVPCLAVTNLFKVASPTVAIGQGVAAASGAMYVADITTGGGTAISDRNALTTRIGLLSGAGVTQRAGGSIAVQDLGVKAGGAVSLDGSNLITNLVGYTTSGGFSFNNAQSFNITTMSGGSAINGYSMMGVQADAGNISLTATTLTGAPANITASTLGADFNAINALTGNVTLTASTGSIFAPDTGYGRGYITTGTTGSLYVTARDGITLTAANRIANLTANNSATGASGNIDLVNTYAPFTLMAAHNSGGNISIDNTGAIVTSGVINASGNFYMIAHSPITVNASSTITAGGTLSLIAGAAGSSAAGDTVTLNGTLTSPTITLAGNTVSGTIPASATVQNYVAPVVTTPVVTTPVVTTPVVTTPVVTTPVVTTPVVTTPVVTTPVVTTPVVTTPVVTTPVVTTPVVTTPVVTTPVVTTPVVTTQPVVTAMVSDIVVTPTINFSAAQVTAPVLTQTTTASTSTATSTTDVALSETPVDPAEDPNNPKKQAVQDAAASVVAAPAEPVTAAAMPICQ